jgi:hypothetical protein
MFGSGDQPVRVTRVAPEAGGPIIVAARSIALRGPGRPATGLRVVLPARADLEFTVVTFLEAR